MKTLLEYLSNYAAYHRDRRNIATHFFGIPMIFFAVAVIASRPAVAVGTWTLSPVYLIALGTSIFYFRLDVRFGALMTALTAACVWGGAWFAAQSLGVSLAGGVGIFVAGWIIQFVGHYFEGRKPAFVDDLIGLLVGPLFVVAEVGFMMGLRDELRREIEARVGPTYIRKLDQPAPSFSTN